MILPDSRYGFNTRRRRPGSRRKLILILTAIVVAVAVLFIWQRKQIIELFSGKKEVQLTLQELWEAQNYEEINLRCEQQLLETPLDRRALVYNGFSFFYRAVSQYSLEEKIPFFDEAIKNLRKALLFDTNELGARISYVLGKAYHFKGRYYTDLTIYYLDKSIELGYIGDDTYEYLGLAHSEIGDYESSVVYFQNAVEQSPNDIRYLVLSQAYLNLGDSDRAEEFLIRALNKTQDSQIARKCRFLLGKIYFEKNELTKAEDEYKKILEISPKSADAHYYLGEIYQEYGKTIEARAEWRKAEQLDPNHYGARLRLYG